MLAPVLPRIDLSGPPAPAEGDESSVTDRDETEPSRVFLVSRNQRQIDSLSVKTVMELQKLLDLASYGPDWKLYQTKESLSVYQHAGNGSLVKAVFKIEGVPPGIALEVLTNDAVRGSWDPSFPEVYRVESKPVLGQDYVYMASRVTGLKPGNDFSQLRTVMRRLELLERSTAPMHVILLEDIMHPAAPLRRGYLRATGVSGYLIQDLQEIYGEGVSGTCLSRVVQSDLQDGEPQAAASAITGHGPVWHRAFKGACLAYLEACLSSSGEPVDEVILRGGEERPVWECAEASKFGGIHQRWMVKLHVPDEHWTNKLPCVMIVGCRIDVDSMDLKLFSEYILKAHHLTQS